MSADSSPRLISAQLVGLDEDLGATSADVIRVLADRVAATGRAADGAVLAEDAIKREASVGTGVPGGIAIPHARSASVSEPTLAFSRLARKVSFGAPDGDADIVFMIAVPEGADKDHLTVLSTLARALIRDDFTAALRAAATPDEIVQLVDREVSGEVSEAGVGKASSASSPAPAPEAGRKVFVGVTACPTGIAHTYMAADALVAAAQRAGAEMHVETQGSSQVEPLDPALIARADAVVFAVDVDVRDRGRFAGKPLVSGPVKRGVDEPDKMIAEAIRASDDPNAPRVQGGARRRGRVHRQERALRAGAQALAAHRRQLHDPVRRGRRAAHRARLPARRVRHRAGPRGRRPEQRRLDAARTHAAEPAAGRPRLLPRCRRVPDRLRVARVPRRSTRRVHRLRHGRPTRHRARLRRRFHRRLHERRVPRWSHRWSDRRCRRVLDRSHPDLALAAWPDARRDHPAASPRSSPPASCCSCSAARSPG